MSKALAFYARDGGFGVPSGVKKSRVAQRKRAGPITQRSMDRNHPLLRKPRQLTLQLCRAQECSGRSPIWAEKKQSGAAEACWAHNPEVDGSKPSSARQTQTAENSMNCFCQTGNHFSISLYEL